MNGRTAGALILAALAGWAAVADTVTVGTNGAPDVTYHSIQAAIDALEKVNPAGDTDPNLYHTILIQAGTYSRGVEETNSFHQHYRSTGWPSDDGRGPTDPGRTHSKSLIVVNDVDEDLDGDGLTNSYLNGLHIIGAGSDRTIIDSKGLDAGTGGRVMFVKNDGVYVQGLMLKGARMVSGEAWSFWRGSGLLSHSSGATWKDIKVEDCDLNVGNAVNCVNFRDVDRVVVDGMEITGYDGPGNALYVNGYGGKRSLLANIRVHDNNSGGVQVYYPNSGWVVIFNGLVHHNTGGGIYSGSMAYHTCYLVNSTVANNTGRAYEVGAYGWAYALNSIFSDNGALPANSGSGMYFMKNLLDESGFTFGTNNLVDGYTTGTGDDGTNLLPPVDPTFKDQTAKDYRLLSGSPAFDNIPLDGTGTNAFLLTQPTNRFVYVDINKNGFYDAQLDVIVKLNGYSPGTNDWVVDKDLAGNPRVRVAGIDAGAYEYQPARGTVVWMK